jgi:hypothetical protein
MQMYIYANVHTYKQTHTHVSKCKQVFCRNQSQAANVPIKHDANVHISTMQMYTHILQEATCPCTHIKMPMYIYQDENVHIKER